MNNDKPLTQSIMDTMHCESPECDHTTHPVGSPLYLLQACHPHDGVAVVYCPETGILHILCNTCDGFVADVRVAP